MSTEKAMPIEKQMVSTGSFRRYVESAAFVAVWMIGGWLLRLDSNSYLLLGVLLLVLFQLGVRRRPLRELWVRDPEQSLRLDRWSVVLAILFMALPAYFFIMALSMRLWVEAAWALCAVVGGIAAGIILRSQPMSALRRALPVFGAALLIGFAIMALAAILNGGSPLLALNDMPAVFKDILLYFAVTFVLEEVAFRGGLDSHVHPFGVRNSGARAWGSALFVSVIWGLWHLPPEMVAGGQTFGELLAIDLFVHSLVGVPLSFTWRQSGTLVLPALAHALIDAYRNAVLA
jgi:hypothetical protein